MADDRDLMFEKFVRHCEESIAVLQARIKLYEVGQLRTGERTGDSRPWVDTTDREIERLKRDIAHYETVLALARDGCDQRR